MSCKCIKTPISVVVLLTFLLNGCTTFVKTAGWIKNPKVEDEQSLSKALEKMGVINDYNYILSVNHIKPIDTGSIYDNMMLGDGVYLVYDSVGNQLLYNGKSQCSGVHIMLFSDSAQKYFIENPSPDTTEIAHNLDTLFSRFRNLDNTTVDKSALPKSKYFVIYPWCKWLMAKGQRKQDYEWFSQTLKGKSVTLVTVNTDLNAHWGLNKKAKLKTTMQKQDDGSYSLELTGELMD